VFVVKREHLSKYLMVYLPYKYQWDGDQNDLVSKEPQHRVYFDWYSLQKNLGIAETAHNKRLERTRHSGSFISSNLGEPLKLNARRA
jgi:hypothetical protein